MYHRENYSTKNNNSEKQFANADRESILYIHQSQEDWVGFIQHCLTYRR